MKTTSRIYRIAMGEKVRLVRATHPSHALMHVARDLAQVSVATPDELIAATKAGVDVEAIKHEQQELA